MWRMALIIFGNISGATKTENRTRPRARALPNENDGAPEQLRNKGVKNEWYYVQFHVL